MSTWARDREALSQGWEKDKRRRSNPILNEGSVDLLIGPKSEKKGK